MTLDSNGPTAGKDSGTPEPEPNSSNEETSNAASDGRPAESSAPEMDDGAAASLNDGESGMDEGGVSGPGAPIGDGAEGDDPTADASAGGDAPGDAPPRPHRSWWDRARSAKARILALRRSKIAWALAVVLVLLLIGWERCGVQGCPSVSRLASYQPGGASVLLDRAGEQFADLGPVDHSVVELSSLPDYVPAAFVAVEDKRFYDHDGVDWYRVFGAAFANLKAGRTTQGSSTITMQLSRNVFPERIRAADRTLRRKLLEVRVARDIERRFTKDEILELYLNHIYFGGGAYGIEAASRQYFGRPAKDLTLEQAAMLAALPKAPANYDPRRHEDRARSRRDLVLLLMAQQGRIPAEQAEQASGKPIRLASARARRTETPRGAQFVQVVRDLLEDRLGEDLYTRPLRIYTTLDMRAQVAAEEELEAQIHRVENGAYGRFDGPKRADWTPGDAQTEYLQGAVVVMDNATGDVLALVGGRDARQSSFNRATQAHRQAGSAFKPFVYATALDRGYSIAQRLDDSPYKLVGSDGKPWEPNNYDGQFLGPISFRDALVFSRNVPTIRLASQVGERNIARLAHDAGIQADLRESPMIALGIAEVSPLELTAAYTAFAGRGRAVEPRFVTRVEDADGNVLWAPEVRSRDVLDPGVAYLMTDLMRDAVDRGTGRSVRSAGYRGLASGKTGTTNDGADAWFVGYTPVITAGIWVGFDKPHEIAPHASGGSVAGYAWGRMLRRMGSWAGGNPWEQPSRVVRVALDPETGLAIEDGCEPRRGDPQTEIFLRGATPETTCPERAGSNGFFDRIGSWIGGLFGGSDSRDVRVESGRPEATERTDRRTQPEYRVRRPDFSGGVPRYRGNERLSDEDWADRVLDAVDQALEQRRDDQREAMDALEEVKDRLERSLDGENRDRIERLLDGTMRAIEQSVRDQRRSEEQALKSWVEQQIRELDRNGGLDARTRAEFEDQLRRALRSWR